MKLEIKLWKFYFILKKALSMTNAKNPKKMFSKKN